jgi:hypothetical protein
LLCIAENILHALKKFQSISSCFYNPFIFGGSMTFIIFSKDRPLQLHGLLLSLANNLKDTVSVIVLFKASDNEYLRRYHEVFRDLARKIKLLAIHEDYSFNYHLQEILRITKTNYVSFLVDDIVFIRSFSVLFLLSMCKKGYIPSLRLGSGISYSYMMNCEEKKPRYRNRSGYLIWNWSDGGVDWTYPLSLDGNIFKKKEIARLIANIEFSSPNTLEQALQAYSPEYRRKKGICFYEPVLVNIPCNKVQTDFFNNRSGDIDTSQLAKKWDSGMRIKVEEFQNISTNSVHVDLPFVFIER